MDNAHLEVIITSLIILVDGFRKNYQGITNKYVGHVLGKQFIDTFEQI